MIHSREVGEECFGIERRADPLAGSVAALFERVRIGEGFDECRGHGVGVDIGYESGAGVFDVGIPVFVAASLLGRAGRFVLVAVLMAVGGTAIKPFVEKYLGWLTLAFVVLLVLGFWAIGRLGGS